jgi:polyphosphate kinase 2 (PPK2 family)
VSKDGKPGRLERLDMKRAPDVDTKGLLDQLQDRMILVQQAYYHQQRRGIVVFEGWDAAGKGGAIRRLTSRLDPRGFHVWPIAAPTEGERAMPYLHRFWMRLPRPGQIAIFDRSWYGRVLVERIEGFAKTAEWRRAYGEIREFERLLTDDGVRILKIFLHITPDEQARRFVERIKAPEKNWKLTEDDFRNRSRWKDYVVATEDMFAETDTPNAPWFPIAANVKEQARIDVLRTVMDWLADGYELAPPPIDQALLKRAQKELEVKFD